MGSSSQARRPRPVPIQAGKRLNSWKEIAAYLETSVRTVQRWERTESLPVLRHEHASVATVYAYTQEVDAWFAGRRQRLQQGVCGISQTEANAGSRRLIVLPFRLIAPDPEIEFLSFALADAITASLSAIKPLAVRSSLVAARYAGENDLDRIAREAAVDLVLIGTLLRSGDRLRVSAQLVQAKSGTVICSQATEGGLGDLFQLQDEVVTRVVDSLTLSLDVAERRRCDRDVPASPAAYEHYLRANELAYNFDPAARDLYLRCIEEDPQYAPAWARLGRCCRIVAKFGGDPESFNQAETALDRALSLNPDLSLAHTQLAYLETDSGRAEQAMLRLLSRAAADDDPELFAGLVHVCRYCGLLEASLKAHEHACQLDPTIRTSICHTYFMQGDYQRALETSKEVLGFLGPLALLSLGRKQEALALARDMERTGTPLPIVRSAFCWVRALAEGAVTEAITTLEHMVGLFKHGPEEMFYSARCFAYLSQIDLALAILARAVDEGFFCYPTLISDPWLDSLRTNPEFERILQRALERHLGAVRGFVDAGGERILGAIQASRSAARGLRVRKHR